MKIGLSYDLKEKVPGGREGVEDAFEEYDSLETVDGITAALRAGGHAVVRLGGGREFLTGILNADVDLVFNIAEGLGNYRSREAQVPSVLEMLDIPYSGSDPQCLAICLDKPLTNKLVELAGVTVPGCVVVNSRQHLEQLDPTGFPVPAFLKPVHEGSSMGVRAASRVEAPQDIPKAVETLLERYRQPVMVEEFVSGEEVTVGIIGNPPEVLGMMHIVPKRRGAYFVYSLEVKRDWENLVEYECPACFEPQVLRRIEDSALRAFSCLGCRDFARMDFRVTSDGTPYFLEVNPLPGLNPRSGDIVIMAKKMGWTYERLINAVLDTAVKRYQRV